MATSTPEHRSATADVSYTDLYRRWELGNWSATEIDFTQDKIDWHEKLTEEQRRAALWFYNLFFHGEDAVTDGLSPYIDAAPLEEQKYFIATQQVDEARHSVFFKRFMDEVVGLGDGTMAGGMAATEGLLTWGHRKVFGCLDEMCERLRRDRSPRQLAAAVTLYHVIIEGTLAQPGQHFMESYIEQLDILPGFREGIRNVALDEQRHIAFGVKLLADLYAENPQETQDAIVETIREVGPYTSAIAMPPGWDETYYTAFGFTYDELGIEGTRSLEFRLKAIGLDLESIPRFPIAMDLPLEERSRRGRVLLEANLTGPDRPAVRDPFAIATMFDVLRRSAEPERREARHRDPVGLHRPRAVAPGARRRRHRRRARPGRAARPAAGDLVRRLGRPVREPRRCAPPAPAPAAAPVGRPAPAAEVPAALPRLTGRG